ncbi:MAG: carboxypeptidase-like regulatory domain-containing protein [Bacteroidota bacterium]
MKILYRLFLFICFFAPLFSMAQKRIETPMDSVITIKERKLPLYEALLEISRQSGVNFSYDAGRINGDSLITINVEKRTLRETLAYLFPSNEIESIIIGNQLIIRQSTEVETLQVRLVDSMHFIYVEGTVLDAETKAPIEFANITIQGTSMGTITNPEGDFLFKIPTSMQDSQLVISHIGYRNRYLSFNQLSHYNHTLLMQPHDFMMEEIVIRSVDPFRVVSQCIDKIKENYLQVPTKQIAFYRETIKRQDEYSLILESVLDVYKAPYSGLRSDQMRVIKMRKWTDFERHDTLSVKFKGGLQVVTYLDIVKHPMTFLEPLALRYYQYAFNGITEYDQRSVYMIRFRPTVKGTMPLYEGVMYIDVENLSLLAAEFQLSVDNVQEVDDMFVFSRSRKIRTKVDAVRYRIGYRPYQGKYYLNHIYCDIDLRIRKKNQLFYKKYATTVEMAITSIDDTNVEKIRFRERANLREVLADKNYRYDRQFWGNYNYLPPNKPLVEAIEEGQVTLPEIDLAP